MQEAVAGSCLQEAVFRKLFQEVVFKKPLQEAAAQDHQTAQAKDCIAPVVDYTKPIWRPHAATEGLVLTGGGAWMQTLLSKTIALIFHTDF